MGEIVKDSKEFTIPDSGKYETPFNELHFWNYLENKYNTGQSIDKYLDCYKDYITELGYTPGVDFIQKETRERDCKLLQYMHEHFWFLYERPKVLEKIEKDKLKAGVI